MQIPCEFLILPVAVDYIESADAELREFASDANIEIAHSLPEIIAGIQKLKIESGNSDCAYINAPDCAPYTDGFIPCGIARYAVDLTRADTGFDYGSNVLLIEFHNDDIIAAIFKSA